MRDFKKKRLVLSILALIFVVASAAICVYSIVAREAPEKVYCAVGLVAIANAVIYFARGYKKSAALYLRIYMISCAVAVIALACGNAYWAIVTPEIPHAAALAVLVVHFVMFANFLLLGFGKDLGRAVSYTLALFNAGVALAYTVASIALGMFVYAGQNFASLTVCLLSFVMVAAKYADKSERASD